jgi:outer membrane protein OmpA-like peptidoglycan-associated protein
MKKIITLFIFICASQFVQSQNFKEDYAKSLSAQFKYLEAYPVWAELSEFFIEKGKGDWSSLRFAVEAAYNSEQYKEALYWNSQITKNNQATVSDWNKQFELLRLNNLHSLLIASTDSAQKQFPAEKSIQEWYIQAPKIVSILKDTSDFKVNDFRSMSRGEEFGAVPYGNGLVFVTSEFSSGFLARKDSWTNDNYYELTFLDDASVPYQEFTLIDKIQNKDIWNEIPHTHTHDGPISFNSDFTKALLTRNIEELDTILRIKYSRLQLLLFKKVEGKWVKDEEFNFNDKHFSTGHGVFGTNNNIVFSSDRPGGTGGADLYEVSLVDGKWGAPKNLGEKINTSADELFPFVAKDGTLYFSSKGWIGMGGLDVFMGTTTANPKNIGIPVNTSSDDFAFYLDTDTGTGYLSSNRNLHRDQIYQITTPVIPIDLEIQLTTCDKKPVENVQIQIENNTQKSTVNLLTNEDGKIQIKPKAGDELVIYFAGNELYSSTEKKSFSEGKEGKYTIALETNYIQSNHVITMLDESGSPIVGGFVELKSEDKTIKKATTDKNGVYSWSRSNTETVETEILCNMINYEDKLLKNKKEACNISQSYTVQMQKMSTENFIELGLILYDFDKYFLRPEGKIELDKLVSYMKERPTLIVELSSHTDCRGSDSYNIELSQNRAQSCVDYIIEKGIEKTRIVAKGYGETKLVNQCSDGIECSPEEHQENRRTELKFILE